MKEEEKLCWIKSLPVIPLYLLRGFSVLYQNRGIFPNPNGTGIRSNYLWQEEIFLYSSIYASGRCDLLAAPYVARIKHYKLVFLFKTSLFLNTGARRLARYTSRSTAKRDANQYIKIKDSSSSRNRCKFEL